jgi:MFS family permease
MAMNATSEGRSRRLLLATGLVAAPALMALGTGFEPPVPDGAAEFQVIAAQSDRYYLAVLATIIGLGLLPAVGAAIAALVQRRGRAAATWAAALFGIGGVAVAVGKGFQIITWLEAAPRLAGYRAAFAHVGDQLPIGSEVFFLVGLVTVLAAAILAAVALGRSRTVPRWLAAAYGVAWVAGLFFSGNPGAGAALAMLPLLVVSIPVARVLLRAAPPEPATSRVPARQAAA